MNYICFNDTAQDEVYQLVDTVYSFAPDGRRIGILLRAPECKIILKNITSADDLTFSLHFVFHRVFHYQDKRNIKILVNGEEVSLLHIDHDHKNSFLSFDIPARLLDKQNLELSLSTDVIHGDKDPVCAGISWKVKQKETIYNSIPVAIQGFTNSGSSTVWDLLSECDNMDVERSAELRFLGRFHNLHNELQSTDKIWNDGCLKHFINQMYYFYNRIDVHGYEISIIHNDEFLRQMNAFFAEMVGATEELSEQLKNASFRFPTEYDDRWEGYSFVQEKDGLKQIFYQISDYVRNNFLKIAYKYLDVFLHSFQGKKYRVFFNLAVRTDYDEAIKMCDGVKFICVYRDPRNQYIQAREMLKKEGIPVNPDFETSEKFVSFYKEQIVPWINSNSENVLCIRFEDFVLHYEKWKKAIFNFLGEDKAHHIWKKMYFQPEASKKNLYWYKTCRNDPDIMYIENQLKDYCLPDPKYSSWHLRYWKIRKIFAFTSSQKAKCTEKVNDVAEQISFRKLQNHLGCIENYKRFVFANKMVLPEKIADAYSKVWAHYVFANKNFLNLLVVFLSIGFVVGYLVIEKGFLPLMWRYLILVCVFFISLLTLYYQNNVSYWKQHVTMLEKTQEINFENVSNTKIRHLNNTSLITYKLEKWISSLLCVVSVVSLLLLAIM